MSRLLGKMWKEVPGDVKLKFKQKAAEAQELFKRDHPNYTYRKERKKRALNELLTKSSQAFAAPPGFPTDPAQMALLAGSTFMIPGLCAQTGAGAPPGQLPPGMAMGIPIQPPAQAQPPHQYPAMPGYAAMGDTTHGLARCFNTLGNKPMNKPSITYAPLSNSHTIHDLVASILRPCAAAIR